MDAEHFINFDHKELVANVSDYYPSMAQDVLWKKYRTEIDTLNGAISDYGKQFGIPTPPATFCRRSSAAFRTTTQTSM